MSTSRIWSASPYPLPTLLFACVLSFLNGTLRAEDFRVGFSRKDITPTEPVRLSGYAARNEPTAEIADRLFARAMVLTPSNGEDNESVVVISADSICVTSELTASLKRLGQQAIRLVSGSTPCMFHPLA